MATIEERISNTELQVFNNLSLINGSRTPGVLYSYIGNKVRWGCFVHNVTPHQILFDDSDPANVNPDVETDPLRVEEYPCNAIVYGENFLTNDSTANPRIIDMDQSEYPLSGFFRFDIVYIFVGDNGADVKMAQGIAVSSGTPIDPEIPAGSYAVARLTVGDSGVVLINDLRQFTSPLQGANGDKGDKGDQGIPGPPGVSVNVIGSDTVANILLKTALNANEGWIATDSSNDIYIATNVATPSNWVNVGQLNGVTEHDQLQNRNLANQHLITDITDLRNEIDTVRQDNLFINADFSYWPRGFTILNLATAYSAARWQSGTFEVTRFQTVQTGIFVGDRYAIRATIKSLVFSFFKQIILNGSFIMSGKTYTLSFNLRKQTDDNVLVITRRQDSGDFTIIANINDPRGSVSHHSYTFTVPTATPAELNANPNQYIRFSISAPTVINDYFEVHNLQIDEGTRELKKRFVDEGHTVELSDYYYKRISSLGSLASAFAQGQIASGTLARCLPYLGKMRAPLTFTSSGAFQIAGGFVSVPVTSIAKARDSTHTVVLDCFTAGGLTLGQGCFLRTDNNNTAYLEFDAELY